MKVMKTFEASFFSIVFPNLIKKRYSTLFYWLFTLNLLSYGRYTL